MDLQLYSIFESLDGEVSSRHAGTFTIFIRLAGCNLQCPYCDTARSQSFEQGRAVSVSYVLETVGRNTGKLGLPKITITGGEPLLQREALTELVAALHQHGRYITIETNGTLPVLEGARTPRLTYVADYKLWCPGAMEINYSSLRRYDWVKFLIGDRDDFDNAMGVCAELRNKTTCGAQFAFSPVEAAVSPRTLAQWIIKERACVTLNTQLHKTVFLGLGWEDG